LCLLFFQTVLFLYQADVVVGELLQTGGLFVRSKIKVFGNGVNFLGQSAQYFFTAA